MPDLDAKKYRDQVLNYLDLEVAELDTMRARFAAIDTPPTRAMAKVCNFASERVQLLRERIRILEHLPEVRRE